VSSAVRSCYRRAPVVMRVWVAAVVAAAVLLPVVSHALRQVVLFPVPRWGEGVTAAVLVAGSAASVEWGRFLEGRVRVGQRPHKGLSAWAMAAVVLLPAVWVLPVVAGVYAYARWRAMRVPLWKWVTSGAILVVAALAAGQVPGIGPGDAPVGLPSGPSGVAAAVAAVLVFLVVESVLLLSCARLCDEPDERWLRRTLADPGFYGTEVAVVSLGMVTGLLAASAGWFVVFLVPVYAVLQQAVLHRPLQDQAGVDAKTGLLRYERWRRLAGDEVSHGPGRPWSVLFADLDHFKAFNDRWGHLAGDRALVVVARVLRETLRERDLIARFGGEEFCVLLPGVPGDVAVVIADRVRRRIGSLGPAELGGRLTISIGVAADQPGDSPVQALTRADRAMYLAKVAGRDTVRLATGPTVDPDGAEADTVRHDTLLHPWDR